MSSHGLMSCTETLGSESSDEISAVDFSANFFCCTNADDPSLMTKSSESRFLEKREFPPPLTTMSQNGRRDFLLKKERKDGRLEIVKVAIQRPKFIRSSRQNGRLTLDIVNTDNNSQNEPSDEEDNNNNCQSESLESEEEEREWSVTTAGLRRCFQYDNHVWAQQQRRWVTTIM